MSYSSLLITGGAGFIGSHVVNLLAKRYPKAQIIVLDALTYAADPAYIKEAVELGNTKLIQGDILDATLLRTLFDEHQIDAVIHLAAESHVDRSIADPLAFVEVNVMGTAKLLNQARVSWSGQFEGKRFYHISTDEVYGALELGEGVFTEETPYDPRSPYSASKAASDHLVRAYYHTYGLPVVISNCSNNYGPHQYPEKLIPLVLTRIFNKEPIPVYGTGANVRDWLYVGDHAEAIALILERGRVGETYNIGTENEQTNLTLVEHLCDLADEALDNAPKSSRSLITFVPDRAGHDLRYAIDPSKLRDELGWNPATPFEDGLRRTIAWYFKRLTTLSQDNQ